MSLIDQVKEWLFPVEHEREEAKDKIHQATLARREMLGKAVESIRSSNEVIRAAENAIDVVRRVEKKHGSSGNA